MQTAFRIGLAGLASYATVLSLSLVTYIGANAQTAQPPAKPIPMRHGTMSGKPIPLNHVYWHFFIYQVHLDQVAAEHEKNQKDGGWLRDHFQKSLGFNDSEFGTVRATAHHVAEEMAKMNQQAEAIIASDRLAIKTNPLPQGVPPPGIAKLKLLTQDRETLLKTQIEQMNITLGSIKAQSLESYLKQNVQNGTNATSTTATVPSSEVRK